MVFGIVTLARLHYVRLDSGLTCSAPWASPLVIQVLVAGLHLLLPLHQGGPRQLPGNGDDDGGDDDNDDPGDDDG